MVLIAAAASAETRTLSFTDFDAVGVGHGMRASIRQGDGYRVEATGTAENLERLEVKQNGRRLEFSLESTWGSWFSGGGITLDIKLPKLRGLALRGGSTGTLDMQIGADPFLASLSGGSTLHGRLGAGDVNLSLSGGSRADLSGTGQRLRLSGSGGSKYLLSNLATETVQAHLSGGSEATVTLKGQLSASLSGGSDVTYHGDAAIGDVHTSGGSRVRKGT
jgi:hypothetical protein